MPEYAWMENVLKNIHKLSTCATDECRQDSIDDDVTIFNKNILHEGLTSQKIRIDKGLQ